MIAQYHVVFNDGTGTYRVIGPGLAFNPESVGAVTFETPDAEMARVFCDGLCRAFRAGERAKQDAIKRALGIQQ